MKLLFENILLLIKQLDTKTEQQIARILFNNSMTISTAESCTGGLISSRLTDIAGSSLYIKENYVTYSNEAKIRLLRVRPETLELHGAVSEECALEMAEGLCNRLNSIDMPPNEVACDISLATTGIAVPGGATETKNVGLMYVAFKNKYCSRVKKIELNPRYGRKKMKFLFSQEALEFLLEFLAETTGQD